MVEEEAAAKVAAKIDSMQKFVPFLSKLIARLEQDSQNAAKVVQMQLLQKILINTEESVSIEELNKCEEALEAIYKIYEAPAALVSETGAEEDGNSLELKRADQVKEIISDNDKQTIDKEDVKKQDDQTEKLVEDTNLEKKNESEKSSTNDKIEDSEECKEADQIIDDEILLLIGKEHHDKSNKIADEKPTNKENDKEKSEEINKTPKAVEKHREKVKVLTNKEIEKDSLGDNDRKEKSIESVKDDKTEDLQNKENIEAGQVEQSKTINKDKASKTAEKEIEKNHVEEIEEDEEELDEEENVELIKMPEEADEDEEMILPDTADEVVEQRGKQLAEEEETDDELNKSDRDTNAKKTTSVEKVNIIDKKQKQQVTNKRDKEKTVEEASEDEEPKENLTGELESDNNKKNTTRRSGSAIKKPKTTTTTINEEAEETTEEPELVALLDDEEEQATSDVDDDDDEISRSNFGGYDPLTCEESNDKAKEQADNDKNKKSIVGAKTRSLEQLLQIEDVDDDDEDDDDDDDVEVIETRNSPICLDSDDEEAATKKQPANSNQASKPAERTFARKSTAKPATVPQIANKPKNWSYLENALTTRPQRRRVVDTIELLDSSDDEGGAASASSRTTTQRSKRTRVSNAAATAATQSSPAKRQLLSALKKNTNKKTQLRTQPPPQLLKRAAAASAAAASAAPQMPRPVHLSTPQSNFLNAVQLQPAFAGANPAAFATQLCNKNVIIPNAFYGNPTRNQALAATPSPPQRGRPRLTPKPLPTNTSEQQQADRAYRRWLENFLTHFAHPQHIASHTCFVLLQRVLKYKLFARIKETRTHLNTLALGANEFIDIQLMLDLRNIFYTDAKQLTDVGRTFCQMASSSAVAGNRPITLTTEARTGRVSSRTRTAEELSLTERSNVAGGSNGGGGGGAGASSFSGIFSAASGSGASPTLSARKRQLDDVEYKPDKAHALAIMESNDGGDSSGGERKRTLRTNRTRRFDNSFSYNEDEDPHEFEDEDDEETAQESAEARAAKAAVQRVIEQKRLEAQRQRERQAKSFENAFISAFSANGFLSNERAAAAEDGSEDNVPTSTSKAKRQQRRSGLMQVALNEASCSSNEAAAASTFLIHDAQDRNERNDDADSLEQFDEEPVQHRIYKVIPAKLTAAAASSGAGGGDGNKRKQISQLKPAQNEPQEQIQRKRGRPRKIAKPPTSDEEQEAEEEEAEIITCDDFDDDYNPGVATTTAAAVPASIETSNNSSNDCVVVRSDDTCVDIDPAAAPRNTDRNMCARSKANEWCVICQFRTPRIVHHYVNLHRGCEVYTARLAERQVARLRRPNGAVAQLHKYKNGQQQFEAACPFCEKTSRFMLPYWYQHFTMHTGEYAYRCTACGIRKPTRSLLLAHINQPCSSASARRIVASVKQDFTFDVRAAQIEARICMLCNYVQLQRANVVAHLKLQHGIKQILPKHIQSIVLLKTSAAAAGAGAEQAQQSSQYKVKTTTAVRGRGGAVYEIEEIDDETNAAAVDDDDGCVAAGDDSFFNYDEESPVAAAAAGNWNDDDGGDPSDDLSFMICGMLDVQMNTE